jgi:meiosis induction protein kinase IME2/SME1
MHNTQIQPKNIYSLFDRTVPAKLIECIADLLKYDPEARLTSRQCLEHPYLLETIPQSSIPVPAALQMSISPPVLGQSHQPNGISQAISLSSGTPRYASHHVLLHDSKDSSDNNSRQYERTQHVTEEYHYSHNVELNPMTRAVIASHNVAAQPPGSKHRKFDSFRLKKLGSKLGTSRMFGQTDKLEPSDEMPITASSSSAPGPKSTQFLITNSHSLSEMPPVQETPAGQTNPKKAKKEAERLEREAQQQRRAMAEKAHREQARAVMQRRNQFISGHSDELDWFRLCITARACSLCAFSAIARRCC